MSRLVVMALLVVLSALLASPMTARAQYGYGTSEVVLSVQNITLYPGQSAKIPFTVKLVSGSTWGTSVSITSSSSYVIASAVPSSGDPTFSGTLTVSVPPDAPAGVYDVNVSAIGDDPSQSPATLYVYVKSNVTTTTTATTSYVATSTTTSSVTSALTVTTTYTETVTTTKTPLERAAETTQVPLVAFVLVVVVSLALIVGLARLSPRKASPMLSILTVVPAVYFLAYDPALRALAPLHYYLLAAYSFLMPVLGALTLVRPGREPLYLIALSSGLMTVAMMLDAALAMPMSAVYSPGSTTGISYFFGMGLTPTSSMPLTLSFTALMLISAGACGSTLRTVGEKA
ncbi:MAG: hypothetical protein ACP5HK_06355 [Acidilobus sp.]